MVFKKETWFFLNLLYNSLQCVGNKEIAFYVFQAYFGQTKPQVIYIDVRSSDRGDLVEILTQKS